MSSQVNYTGTYLTDHLDGLTHDNVRCFLKTKRFTPRQRWPQVRPEVVLSTRGYVLSGDAVPDKHHSRRIELVRRQYSGNAHGVRAGTGPVTCVYANPETDQFCHSRSRPSVAAPVCWTVTSSKARPDSPVNCAKSRFCRRW